MSPVAFKFEAYPLRRGESISLAFRYNFHRRINQSFEPHRTQHVAIVQGRRDRKEAVSAGIAKTRSKLLA